MYCTVDMIKERMLIALNDTQYDDALNSAANEASDLIDLYLRPYEDDLPLDEPDNQIIAITADFAASIFKRRMLPEEIGVRGPQQISGIDSLTQIDATGWFALALKKLEQYIRNTYVLVRGQITSIHNPEIYADLFRRGLLTGQETRDFLNNATAVYIKRIEEITKTITETITRTTNDTVTEYKTKRQKSFVFVGGKNDSDEYEVNDEYYGE